ncbi:MAG: hypothetical protein JWM99_436, partial [Verrucomicrobiales bacterium]|nr:hypothetical protein [Verrucomicrobiales bacterium]
MAKSTVTRLRLFHERAPLRLAYGEDVVVDTLGIPQLQARPCRKVNRETGVSQRSFNLKTAVERVRGSQRPERERGAERLRISAMDLCRRDNPLSRQDL